MSDVQGAQDAPEHAPNEAEREARNLGWVGKEEFKGDPSKWRPAEEFLDRGRTILPIVLNDNKRLQRNLDRVKDELKEIRDSTKQLIEFHTTAAKREYERGRREVEAKIEAAAANADQGAVRAGMQELDALNKQHAAPVTAKTDTQQKPPVDPVIQDWIEKEPWFNKNRTLNAFATDVYGALERDKPGMSTAELLTETKKRTMDKFPEMFGINPEREHAAAVGEPTGTGGRVSRKNDKTYENLPPEAKAACNKFVKTIPGYTKEKYVADYDWEA